MKMNAADSLSLYASAQFYCTDSESVSETTTNGSLSRSSSMEHLPEGYVEERFRVDRRKLEAMILGCLPDPWDTQIKKIPISSDGRVMSADEFFQTIMQRTSTEIRYPKYLKFGGRNKKDPYVRVIGLPQAVEDASKRVQLDLQPPNKITMKMDVPWTCHSHIIGKSGNTIQPVVKKTGVSIHFPDGNKNSDVHKSNQVSINSRGEEISGLEEARSAVRELTPLTFSFTLPATGHFITPSLNLSLLVLQVQNSYNVQADLHICHEGSPMIVGSVKGTEWDASRVKEATLYMLQNLYGSIAHQLAVHTTIEISPQHHTFVLGKNSENLRQITRRTTTEIIFPDPNDCALSPLKKYTVMITGAINNVYVARQNLIGSLPLVLMFDLQPEQSVNQREIDQLMQTLDVCIIARNKRPDGRRSIIVRGAERNVGNIYEAWQLITKNDKPAPKAKIPLTYHVTDIQHFLDLNNYYNALVPGIVVKHRNNNSDQQIDLNIFDSGLRATKDGGILAPVDKDLLLARGTGEGGSSDTSPVSSGQPSPLSSCQRGDLLQISELDFQNILDLIPDRRAPGWEKKQREIGESADIIDYFAKKLLAAKAMREPVTNKPRTPTSNWSGYGFSKSMPGFVINQLSKDDVGKQPGDGSEWDDWKKDSAESVELTKDSQPCGLDTSANAKLVYGMEDYRPEPNKATSNYMDAMMFRSLIPSKTASDLNSLLINLQLEQYIDLFRFERIDLDIFSKLTDQDLKDLGVYVFGHRKKLLMAIKNLHVDQQRQRSVFD